MVVRIAEKNEGTGLNIERPETETKGPCPLHLCAFDFEADYGKTVRGIVSGEPGFLKLIFDRS